MDNNVGYIQRTIIRPDGSCIRNKAAVVKEHKLTVIVNGQPLYRIVCIKEYLNELVAGRLYTEGLINSADDILAMSLCQYEVRANVILGTDLKLSQELITEPTCCTDNQVLYRTEGRRPLYRLNGRGYSAESVFELARVFSEGTPIHSLTRGTHSCFIADDGGILFSCEDIGRHNAVDKAVGYGVLNNIDLSSCMIFTSGRVPVDMVRKVIAAGIPVLVSKSVPTADSAEMAKEYGLTLICGSYPDKIEIY